MRAQKIVLRPLKKNCDRFSRSFCVSLPPELDSMQQHGMQRRHRSAARVPGATRTENSSSQQSASAPEWEMAVIGALRAAVLASGLAFNEENSAEDLLVTLLKQRQPSLLSPQD